MCSCSKSAFICVHQRLKLPVLQRSSGGTRKINSHSCEFVKFVSALCLSALWLKDSISAANGFAVPPAAPAVASLCRDKPRAGTSQRNVPTWGWIVSITRTIRLRPTSARPASAEATAWQDKGRERGRFWGQSEGIGSDVFTYVRICADMCG